MLRNVGLRKSVEQPVLDLNFAAAQIGSNAAPDSRIDFSRGTNAWFVDSDGLVKKSPHNLLTNSEDVTVWTVFNTTVSANAAESPTGELTADKVIADSGQTTHIVRRDITGLDDSVDVAVSVYLKQAGFTSVAIQFYDKNSTFHSSGNFDLTDGSRISNATSGTQSSIEHVGNDWYRVTFTGIDTGTGSSNPSIRFGASGTGDGSKGFLIWGAQFSQHSTLPVDNPYLKTTGSAVYAARLDHDPSWFMSAAQEQNLLEYSEMLDNSGWTKYQSTVTANAAVAPDGTTTAEKLASSNTLEGAVIQDVEGNPSVTYVFSIYLKKDEFDEAELHLNYRGGGSSLYRAIYDVDLTAGTIAYQAGSTATTTITDDGDGWFRVTISQPSPASTDTVRAEVNAPVGNASGDGILVWGAQLEVGSTASTYHRTEGAPYYGPGATPKGLLIEEQRANLIGYSEDFSASGLNPAQSPGGSLTLTHNDALAPDGTTTATKLVATSSGGDTGHLLYKVVSVDNDTTVTASVFMKNAGQRWGYLQLANTGYVSDKNAYADLENGVLGAASDSSATIEDYGNGWYRVSLTNTTDSDGGNDVVAIGVAEDDGDPIFTGDDTNGIYIWGWQKEVGSFPTSYIQTTGTTLTRNADVATMGPTTGGTELVTNGTFDTDVSNWTANSSNISYESGVLRITADTAGVGANIAVQSVSTVIGRRYRATLLHVGQNAGGRSAKLQIRNAANNSTIAESSTTTNNTTITVDFTAIETSITFRIRWDGISSTTTSHYIDVDNASLRELYPFEQFNQSEGTIVAEMTQNTLAGGSTYYPSTLVFQEGTGTDGIYFNNVIGGASDTLRYIYIASDGVAQVNGIGQTVASGTPFVHALSYAANDVDNFISGSVPSGGQSDNSATLPHPDRISFNYSSKGAYYIKRMTYFNRKVSDDTLQFLSDV